MIEPFSIQTILTYLTLMSIPIGVIYHVMTLRNTRKNQQLALETRQAQLFMDLYAHMRGKEFVRDSRELTSWEWKDFEDFRSKYGSRGDQELNSIFVSTGNFFDGIGVLVKRGLVDITMVDDLMAAWALWYWERFGSIIKDYRKVSNPQYFEWVEYLYNQIQSMRKENQSPE